MTVEEYKRLHFSYFDDVEKLPEELRTTMRAKRALFLGNPQIPTSSSNNNTAKKSIAGWRFADYFKTGWKWCSICDIWYEPQDKDARFCKECRKRTRSTIRKKNQTKRKREKEEN